jgi:MFS family permease
MLHSLKHKITETYDILGHRTFLFASLTIAFYTMCKALRVTVMGWYIYKVTGNPVHLGFIGLAEAIPYILTNPIGGYLADRYGRKRQSTILTLLTIVLTAHLCWLVSRDFSTASLIQIYIDFCLFGAVRGTFGSGAMSSLIALSVPRKQFQKANAWNGTFTQTGMVLGPVMGGLIYNFYGVVWANAVVLLFMLVILVFLYFIVDTPVIPSSAQMFRVAESDDRLPVHFHQPAVARDCGPGFHRRDLQRRHGLTARFRA